MIRPVLEYACPVWPSGLTVEHRNRIEAIQKRVFRIIFVIPLTIWRSVLRTVYCAQLFYSA